jgi:uncharacterized protein DUF4168
MVRTPAIVALVVALGMAAGAAAQVAAPEQAQATAPTLAPSQPPPQAVYSDPQMRAFAKATLDLQALGSQDAGAMSRAIEATGMSVERYNAMGDAMRADPALAARLNPYLDNERMARFASRSYAPASYEAYAAGSGSRRHHAGSHWSRHQGGGRHHGGHASHGSGHGAPSHHHAAAHTGRHSHHH